ncbi:MAG: zinc ribbon domain-containing protein [Leptospiraceae bacterium]|nr:zinc ribbon domain-containing protein [Leptospiraceae bacterium]
MSNTIISSMDLCPKCKNANPEGSKFCMQCGTHLTVFNEQKSVKLIQIDSSGKPKKEVLIDSSYEFNKNPSDFDGFDSRKNKIEIKIENGKILLKDNGSTGIYLKLISSDNIELHLGQEIYIDGNFFKVE